MADCPALFVAIGASGVVIRLIIAPEIVNGISNNTLPQDVVEYSVLKSANGDSGVIFSLLGIAKKNLSSHPAPFIAIGAPGVVIPLTMAPHIRNWRHRISKRHSHHVENKRRRGRYNLVSRLC